jgi:hypothetical protein
VNQNKSKIACQAVLNDGVAHSSIQWLIACDYAIQSKAKRTFGRFFENFFEASATKFVLTFVQLDKIRITRIFFAANFAHLCSII